MVAYINITYTTNREHKSRRYIPPATNKKAIKMSTTINIVETITAIRAIKSQLAALEKGLEHYMPKEENTVKTKKVKAVKDALSLSLSLPPPTTAPVRLMTVPEEKLEKEKRKPSAWAIHCRDVLIPVIMRLKKEHGIKVNHLITCGYIKEKNLENPTESEVLESLRYLAEHPDYKSTHQKKKIQSTDASSVPSGEGKKARGRPKKIKITDSSSVSSDDVKTV